MVSEDDIEESLPGQLSGALNPIALLSGCILAVAIARRKLSAI